MKKPWRNSEGPLTVLADDALLSRIGQTISSIERSPYTDTKDHGRILLMCLQSAGFDVIYREEPKPKRG